jgi:hypothetical protein
MKAANLIAAASVAAALAVPTAGFPAQTFGRDSVYATQSLAVKQAPVATSTARAGRDSVYATQSATVTRPVNSADVTPRLGRA